MKTSNIGKANFCELCYSKLSALCHFGLGQNRKVGSEFMTHQSLK